MNQNNEKTKAHLAQSPHARQKALAQFILETSNTANTLKRCIDTLEIAQDHNKNQEFKEHLEYLEKQINDHAEKRLGTRIT